MPKPLRLGLIGDNIAQSQSPRLHGLAGRQFGIEVQFDLLVPREQGLAFGALLESLPARGYRGVSVTYPYKEQAMARVVVPDDSVRALGAVNTVIFEGGNAIGFNTDYSGFMAAYRQARPQPPGDVLLIGTGGVGRAIAFALAQLGATRLRLVDQEPAKADLLASVLGQTFPALELEVGGDVERLATGATGIVNCSPVGMAGHEGTPIPPAALPGAKWAFDAVYTPPVTRFLRDARELGVLAIPGTELFFHQGIAAWTIFSGRAADIPTLRATFFDVSTVR